MAKYSLEQTGAQIQNILNKSVLTDNDQTIPGNKNFTGTLQQNGHDVALEYNHYTKAEIDDMMSGLNKKLSINATSILSETLVQMIGITLTIKDVTDTIIGTYTYQGATLDIYLPKNQVYKINATKSIVINNVVYFNPVGEDMEGTLSEDKVVNITYSNPGTMVTIQDATAFLATTDLETARTVFIGDAGNLHNFETEITITNPETSVSYNMTLVADKVYQAEDEEGNLHNAILWTFKYELPDNYVFDEREQIRASGDNFEDGIYYYKGTRNDLGDQTFTVLTAGTDYTVGASVNTWESSHPGYFVYKHEWPDNKFGTGSKSTSNLMRYGCNYYLYSNIHKWMNGSGLDWWEPDHLGDVLGSAYQNKHGFKDWFTPEDLESIKTVKYGVNNIDTAGSVYCDFVLLSGTEVAGSVNTGEGEVLARWLDLNGGVIKNDANANRTAAKITAKTSKQTFWLRSPYRSNSYNPWGVYSSGYVSYSTAYFAYALLAAFTTY